MATTANQSASDVIYAGPLENDPLTDGELAILLAIPRGAEETPNGTVFRLPLGPDPAHGWVDVTYSEARSIIPRLAVDWKSKLSNEIEGLSVGPGTTVCLLVKPDAHMLFHWLALWALGCSIQFVSSILGDEFITTCLNNSGCQILIHSGISNDRVENIRSGCNVATIQFPEGEHAHQLALSAKQDQTGSTLPWPQPQRPDPAIILHSSGSTGIPKLFRLSLYFYTLGLSVVPALKKIPDRRPVLFFCSPYWQSFNAIFCIRLVAGIPMAFAPIGDFINFPPGHFIDWVRGLGVGGVVCPPRFVRDVLISGSEANISLLQGLYNIRITGSAMDETTSALAEKYKLNLTNIFGCSELGVMLITSKPPFTHMRRLPRTSRLVHPISDTESDGPRHVQFWFLPSTSLILAHQLAKGGVSLQLEPFPGEGPHKGELAYRWDDVFKEIPSPAGISSEPLYIPIGRTDDFIRLQTGGRNTVASLYEAELTSAATSYLASQSSEGDRWVVDAVQLFGSNRRCTSLVIQLCAATKDGSNGEVGREILEQLSKLVELVNNKLKMDPHHRVHPQKRVLVLAEGKAYGPGAPFPGEAIPRLAVTHKRTLQRWKNVEAFTGWMDGLDYSDP